jgi:glycosyltransferase involved in cell wall biosynthesis
MGGKSLDLSPIPTPIDLILLLQDLEYGGTQRYATHLLRNLNRNLFSPRLWVLRGGDDMLPMALGAGVELRRLSEASWVGPKALCRLAWRLVRERPCILYTLTVVPNIWGRLFGTLVGVPVIVSSWRSLFPQQYEGLMWSMSDRIIANSQTIKELHCSRYKVAPKRVAVIPNGVEPHFFTPDPLCKASEPTVLFVGRLARIKALPTLLEAFQFVSKKIPEAKLKILGKGPLAGKMERYVHRQSLEPRVELIEGTGDIRPYLRQAWVLVLSSTREASPNVILEAMSSGLPVVAPAIGGIPELLIPNESGIIYEPGNPHALAQGLVSILENDSMRLAMGRRGREHVLAFHTMESMIAQTEKVLLDAVREKFEKPFG